MESSVWLYTLLSVALVSLVSLVGIMVLSLKFDKIRGALIYLVSFSAGALMGDVFLHLLPEAIEEFGFGLSSGLGALSGIVTFLILEKIIHWHHHHNHIHHHTKRIATMNLMGDGVHNFIDGLIIGASYLVSIPVGIATTIAVILHEIPQEIGDFGVLLHGGFSKRKALFFNFLTALTAVGGALFALLLGNNGSIERFLIPFAAGGFVYIAGSDLIPELHKDDFKLSRSVKQLMVFILGICVMMALLLLE